MKEEKAFPKGVVCTSGEGGSVLRVGKGTVATDTIRYGWDGERSLSMVMEEASRATAFLTVRSGPPERILNVTLAEGAQLSLIVLVSGLSDARLHQTLSIGSGGKCRLLNVTLGGKGVQQDVVATVEGEGGESAVDWIFHVAGEESQKLAVRNVFRARNGGGQITVKGVAEGKARVGCDGMIEITEGGGGTATFLKQDILMLDATAHVDAVPGLQIRTNDVKASHSATVTKVSEEELFYFASRGIKREEARAMYIHGFLKDLLSKIEDAAVREEIEDAMEGRMGHGG